MADEPNIPSVDDLRDKLASLSDEIPGGRHRYVVLFAIIAGGGLLLLWLIHRNAQTVSATPAAAGISPDTFNLTEVLDEPPATTGGGGTTSTPAPGHGATQPVLKPPTTGRVNGGNPITTTKATPKPTPATPKPAPAAKTYVVVSGDTLSSIAARHGTTTAALYSKNKGTIDAWAKAHGKPAPYDNWLYPGEILDL